MKLTAAQLRRIISETISAHVTDATVNSRLMDEFSERALAAAADEQTRDSIEKFRTKVLRMVSNELNRLGSAKKLNPMELSEDLFEDDDLLIAEQQCFTDVVNALSEYAAEIAAAAARAAGASSEMVNPNEAEERQALYAEYSDRYKSLYGTRYRDEERFMTAPIAELRRALEVLRRGEEEV